MKKIICIVINLFLIVSICSQTALAEGNAKTRKISGTVMLDSYDKAPKGGLVFEIIAASQKQTINKDVTIKEGQSTAFYQLEVPVESQPDSSYIFSYVLKNSKDYIEQGYYRNMSLKSMTYRYGFGSKDYAPVERGIWMDHTTVFTKELATPVDVSSKDQGKIDFMVYPSTQVVKGSISLPQGEQLGLEDIIVDLSMYKEDSVAAPHGPGFTSKIFDLMQTVTIPAGKTSAPFSFTLPVSSNKYYNHFILTYRIQDASMKSMKGYLRGAVLGAEGTQWACGTPTFKSINLSTDNVSDIKIVLAHIDDAGNEPLDAVTIGIGESIKGKIDYDGDRDYFIFTPRKDGLYLIEPQSKEIVSVIVRPEKGSPSDPPENCFYGVAGKKYYIGFTHPKATGEYRYLIKSTWKKSYSGTVSLPNRKVAPKGGIRVALEGYNFSAWVGDYVKLLGYTTIQEGKNSVNFKISVPETLIKEVQCIRYTIDSKYGYAENGYYTGKLTHDMFSDVEGASAMDGYYTMNSSIDPDHINLQILPKVKRIMIYGNVTAKGTANITLSGRGEKVAYTGNSFYFGNLKLGEGEFYRAYIKIIKDFGFGKKFTLAEGYYSENGLIKDLVWAKKFTQDASIKVNHIPSVKPGLKIANAVYSDIKVFMNGDRIPALNAGGQSLIAVEDLAKYGNDLSFDKATKRYIVKRNAQKKNQAVVMTQSSSKINKVAGQLLTSDCTVQMKNKELDCVSLNGRQYIVVKDLWGTGWYIDYVKAKKELRISYK